MHVIIPLSVVSQAYSVPNVHQPRAWALYWCSITPEQLCFAKLIMNDHGYSWHKRCSSWHKHCCSSYTTLEHSEDATHLQLPIQAVDSLYTAYATCKLLKDCTQLWVVGSNRMHFRTIYSTRPCISLLVLDCSGKHFIPGADSTACDARTNITPSITAHL